jgi:hypothetical protein
MQDTTNRSAESAGSADAYYRRPRRPNKSVNHKIITDLTELEKSLYYRAYDEQDDFKQWD